MNLTFIAISFLSILLIGYNIYGSFVAKNFKLNHNNITPSHQFKDDIDFLPTKPFYLFAQHFSAIAAAGPIAGPIIACQIYGWLPCLLWIGFGVILIGAVHDFSILTASVKHEAKSIADIVKEHLGKKAGIAMLAFIWIALIYVIVAFTDITASSFVSGTEELLATKQAFNPGGAVAMASTLYLFLALFMGIIDKLLKPPLWLLSIVFVPATFLLAWIGTYFSNILVFDTKMWCAIILFYCLISSLIPVWALLQPRGYLGGFVLYSALFLGVVGIFFGNYEINQPAIKTVDASISTNAIFPFLFVTIACGACSGFHGLVCSGTTSKQIDKESHLQVIGYGAMLAEAFVAFIALVTIMILTPSEGKGLQPGTVYGNGIGEFMTIIIGSQYKSFAITFGAMAFSTFVFDTLDVSTRLGRYIFQEITGLKNVLGSILGTLASTLPAFFLLVFTQKGSWKDFWTLFGASNQLLAALTLLSISVWLYHSGKKFAFALLPMFFVMTITLWALFKIAISNFQKSQGLDTAGVNGFFSILLILLAIFIAINAVARSNDKPLHL